MTIYLYDGLNAIIERNWGDDTIAYYTRGLGYGGGIGSIISALLPEEPGENELEPLYYHYDGIGAVTALTDDEGEVEKSYIYDAYGNILSINGDDVVNPYRFSTKELLPKLGLVYFGARYYDPRIGRFITPDPLTWGPDDPRVLAVSGTTTYPLAKEIVSSVGSTDPSLFHRYVYCANDPVNYIDHYGLDKWSWWKDWWKKLLLIEMGDEAAQWYADRYVATGKWYYFTGGLGASLWTSDT